MTKAALAEPKVRIHVQADPSLAYAALARRIAVRHVSDDSLVAVIEIVSAANKDRPMTVEILVKKVAGNAAVLKHRSICQRAAYMLAYGKMPERMRSVVEGISRP